MPNRRRFLQAARFGQPDLGLPLTGVDGVALNGFGQLNILQNRFAQAGILGSKRPNDINPCNRRHVVYYTTFERDCIPVLPPSGQTD